MDSAASDVAAVDDPESLDAQSLDLAPRDRPVSSGRSRRPWLAGIVLVAVLAGLVWVLVAGLSDATTFFYNVDDAVAARDEIGDRRVRLQGNVVDGSVTEHTGGLSFTLRYGSAQVEVDHRGDVPPLFQPAIPVVVEGRFEGDGFTSDRVLVKHDETYDEVNPDRIRDANSDAERQPSSTP